MSTQKAVKSSESRRKIPKAVSASVAEVPAPVPAVVPAPPRVAVAPPREEEDAVVEAEGLDDGSGVTVSFVPSADDASTKAFREDPVLDRRIIEGMLQDRNTFLEQMEREGFTSAAVLRRAAELGLSEALIRQVKGVAADLAGERPGRRPAPSSLGARTCLSCDRVFLSSGPGNRLCMRCRGGDAGLAQL
jgi:hypothetical protein